MEKRMGNLQDLANRQQRLRKQFLGSLQLWVAVLSLAIISSHSLYEDLKELGVGDIWIRLPWGLAAGLFVWWAVVTFRFLHFRYNLSREQKIKIPLLDEREKHQALVVHAAAYWGLITLLFLSGIMLLFSTHSIAGIINLAMGFLGFVMVIAVWTLEDEQT